MTHPQSSRRKFMPEEDWEFFYGLWPHTGRRPGEGPDPESEERLRRMAEADFASSWGYCYQPPVNTPPELQSAPDPATVPIHIDLFPPEMGDWMPHSREYWSDLRRSAIPAMIQKEWEEVRKAEIDAWRKAHACSDDSDNKQDESSASGSSSNNAQ